MQKSIQIQFEALQESISSFGKSKILFGMVSDEEVEFLK